MSQSSVVPPAEVALLGGSGFVGSALARQLHDAGYSVRILSRHERATAPLAVLPRLSWRLLRDGSVEALAEAISGCAVLVNLVGVLHASAAGFQAIHVDLTARALQAAQQAGVGRYLQVSALGASPDGPSDYLRSKAAAEALVRAAPLATTILQPSVVFGRDDRFLNLFIGLARRLPVLVLPCPQALFQPIHVEDVARAMLRCLELPATIGATLELAGPVRYRLYGLVREALTQAGLRPPILGLPAGLSMLQAGLLEWLPGGLMSRDNVRSMQLPNVASGPFPALLGFEPAALSLVLPGWLAPGSGRGRYSTLRARAGR